MQTAEAIAKRKSVRAFLDQEIPKDTLQQLVEAGRLAPTARNEQPWEFVVVTDKDKKLKIASIVSANGPFIAGCASVIAVYCLDTKYYLEDGCAATQNILIRASDLGIGSCWVAGDKKPYCQQINRLLGVPERYKLISLIALGYPAEDFAHKADKKPLEAVLHWQKF